MRRAVFEKYGRRCYHPGCRFKITKTNWLCVHDITYTGDHSDITKMRPVCMIHHNRATANRRYAQATMRRLIARGVPTGPSPCPTLAQKFYGPAKRN